MLALGALLLSSAASDFATQERLVRYRVLGKAFYENPTTQLQAVEQLKLALDANPKSPTERLNYGLALLRAAKTKEGIAELEAVQKQDPALPHTWFNLGIEYKKQGDPVRAIQQLEGMARLVPDEPITQYNLGVLYKQTGRQPEALQKFELTARMDENLAAPHFQMFNALRQAGKREEAQKELARFQEIKARNEAVGNTEDVEWCRYAELYEAIDGKLSDDSAAVPLKFVASAVPGKADAATAQLYLADFDADGVPDVLVVSSTGVALFHSGVRAVPMPKIDEPFSAAIGDFNNDGLPDVCVLTASGPALLENSKSGFAVKDIGLPHERFDAAAWLDHDHDYDQDLLLFGKRNVLLRNQGQAGFAERTQDFPFADGAPLAAVNYRLIPDSKALDLVVSYADRPAVLYRDKLGGKYVVETTPVPAGARQLVAADLNNDGYLDLAFRAEGPGVAWNREGKLDAGKQVASSPEAWTFADLGNRGLLDLVLGREVLLNRGSGQWALPATAGLDAVAAWAAADFDNDGRTDLFAVKKDGTLVRFSNQSPAKAGWLRVQLTGIKNLKIAPGSEVEVKAGALYQKKIYAGYPLLFGLRSYSQAETIRITWPNGLIQNEIKKAAGKPYVFEEAQRLSGSCPVIWTWNGREFEYITDVLGVAPLGASSGDGKYFPVDHDEYIQIRGDQLVARDGKYEVRITEELSEVSYLDQVKLIAVDHPAGVEIYTNDKWKSPPFPEFRLFGASRRIHPKATDDNGADVTELVARRDRRYPEGFTRDLNGVARRHTLTLDFGQAAAANRAVLVLNGWVDWADGSTFLNQAQQSETKALPDGRGSVTVDRRDALQSRERERAVSPLTPPQLQVKDAQGRWVTVLEDMGMPAGKPKTIAVDLTGKFLSRSREVRIVTNLCIFWDEISLIEDSAAPEARLTEIVLVHSDLHFRGFSRAEIHPQRRQPEQFFYLPTSATSLWNPTPGLYTRYGEVTPLLKDVDDSFVIMGSGDEAALQFDSSAFLPLSRGWQRDFLLKVDGWAKDRDANTAYSQTVEPLPFHAMSSYPYPSSENYPNDESHQQYRSEYNARPALRLLRPLTARRFK